MDNNISFNTLLKSNVNILGIYMNIAGLLLFILFTIILMIFIYYSVSCNACESFNIMDKYSNINESIKTNIDEMREIFNKRKPLIIKQDDNKKKSELDFFYNTEFNPLCCSRKNINTSSSDGCPCLSVKQKSYILTRGNNI